MRRLSVILLLVILPALCLTGATPSAQSQNTISVAPVPKPHKRSGFFDYLLDKINPSGNDYGASMQTRRDAVTEHTVDDLYFWSNVVTLLLLTSAVAVILLQWRSADKREEIAAALIAELWNGRISDQVEIERRTEQFNRLVESHNAGVERALLLKSQTPESSSEASVSLTRNVRSLAENRAPAVKRGKTPETITSEVSPSATPEGTPTELQQSTLLLQRRLEAMQSNEQNLKQRLNNTTLLLDQERRRNATLKGA